MAAAPLYFSFANGSPAKAHSAFSSSHFGAWGICVRKESSRHYQLNQPCHAAGVLRSAGYGSRLATALLVAQLKTENMEAFIVRFFFGTPTLSNTSTDSIGRGDYTSNNYLFPFVLEWRLCHLYSPTCHKNLTFSGNEHVICAGFRKSHAGVTGRNLLLATGCRVGGPAGAQGIKGGVGTRGTEGTETVEIGSGEPTTTERRSPA